MPAQQRLWRCDQATSAWLRQDSRQRGKEGAIGWAQRRASLLPSEHDQLMPQDEQLDVLSELAAAAPDQEPQHSGKGEIGAKASAIWYSRARETPKRHDRRGGARRTGILKPLNPTPQRLVQDGLDALPSAAR
jgi:hypothetical protein